MKIRANKAKRTITLTASHYDIGYILNRAVRQMESDLNNLHLTSSNNTEYKDMLKNTINELASIEHSIQNGDYFA